MRRRMENIWKDDGDLHCPVCQYTYLPRVVIDNNTQPGMERMAELMGRHGQQAWFVGAGVTDATCPACATPYVLKVEFMGPFFDKSGPGIYPQISFCRVPVDLDFPDREFGEEDLVVVDAWRLEMRETGIRGQEERGQRSEVRGQEEKERRRRA